MLRYRADIRTLGIIATYFGLLVTLWVVPLPLWALIPAVFFLAMFSWICAVATHNTIHCPMFHKKWVNKATQVVLSLTYGHPVSTFVPGHNLSHHKFTQQPRDVMRTTKMRWRWNLLNGLFFFFTVAPAIAKGEAAFVKMMRRKKPAWFRQLLIEAGVLIAVSALLLLLDWRKFLYLWYLPHFVAAWGIVTMNLLQHDGADEESEYDHSRNFVGKLLNWWLLNNGYHTIHHMHPSLHWSELPEAHARLVKPHIHPALDQRSLFLYIVRTFLWPAKRLRYDGEPVVLPPKVPDDNWVPASPERRPEEVSLGAEA